MSDTPTLKKISDILELSSFVNIIKHKREVLREKFEEARIFRYDQGLFRADEKTILLAKLFKEEGKISVMLDLSGTPIEVKDISLFLEEALKSYHFATNEYLNDFKALQILRSKEAFLDE